MICGLSLKISNNLVLIKLRSIMKYILTVFILVLISSSLHAQARIGASISEIRQEFWETKYNLKGDYDDDGDYYIQIDIERATVFYYFNEEKICYMTVISPDNQGALNYFVELYNNNYVIVSETKWKMYSKDGIANIELIFDGDFPFFIWK